MTAARSRQQALEAKTVVLFDLPMGRRLRVARQKMRLQQGEFAPLIGITQQELSRLERGQKARVSIPITTLKSVLGKFFVFVALGFGSDTVQVTAGDLRAIHARPKNYKGQPGFNQERRAKKELQSSDYVNRGLIRNLVKTKG